MKTITPDTSASAAPQQQHPQQQMPMQSAIIPQHQQKHITPVIMEATAHVNLVDDDDEKDPLALDATTQQTVTLGTPHQQHHQPANNSILASPNKHTHSLRFVINALIILRIIHLCENLPATGDTCHASL